MSEDRSFRLLSAAAEAGRPALAIELARRRLAECPDDPWTLLLYSGALRDVARYEDARAAAERALGLLGPYRKVHALRELGHTARARGDLGAAEAYFRRVVEARPLDAGGYIYLGALCAGAGRLEEAEAWHRRALGCPEGARDEAYLDLGLVLRARGEYLEALDCFRRALEIDPEDGAAREALADVEAVLFEFPEG